MNKLKKIIKEPILLFFLIGIILFIFYAQAASFIEKRNKQVYVSKSQIELLGESFKKTWNRNPTETEFTALIDNFVMDEIFFKEAVDMGLDKTDPAVKRRLRQIMELMLDDFATIYPTEVQLRKYLSDHPEKFRRDSRISFQHVYFTMEDKEKAVSFLIRLQKSLPIDERSTGNLLMIPNEFDDESEREIERLFGKKFTANVFELETGNWHGPVESAYGWHLVNVSNRIKGEVPDLNEIWDVVEREWSVERKKKIKEEQYKVMRVQYNVTIEDFK